MRDASALAVPAASRLRAEPRKGRAPAPRKSPRAPSLVRRAFARPGVTIAGAAFAAVMTGIVANAVLFQKGHHPSPLFAEAPPARVMPLPPERPAVVPPAAPVVATLPAVSPDPPVAALTPAVVHAPRPAAPPTKVHRTTAAAPPADPIAGLLGSRPAAGAQGRSKAPPVAERPKPSAVVKAKPAVAAGAEAPHN